MKVSAIVYVPKGWVVDAEMREEFEALMGLPVAERPASDLGPGPELPDFEVDDAIEELPRVDKVRALFLINSMVVRGRS